MANWALNIATGGNVSGANPYDTIGGGAAQLAGKTIPYSTNLGASLDTAPQQFSAFGGGGSGTFGGSGGTGAVGSGSAGGTVGTPGTPGSPGTPAFGTASALPPAGSNQQAIAQWWAQNQGKTVSVTNGRGETVQQTISGNAPNPGQWNSYINNGQWKTGGGTPAIPGTAGTAGTGGGGGGAGGGNSILGPFLQSAWDAIIGQEQAVNELPGLQAQTQGLSNEFTQEGKSLMDQGNSMLNQATSGTGLYTSQQAMVDQATKSQQAAIQQQMASEGLTSSTQNVQLQGQAAQQGAATAGQLVQGNISAAQQQIQLGQASQKLALGAQELSLGEQAALTQELSNIATQSAGFQQQMWSQAVQGFGLVGSFINTAVGAFDYSNNGWKQFSSASADNAANAVSLQTAAMKSSSDGMSSLLGAAGNILGGSGGGSGGGLMGSLGGLFGGIGGTVGGAAAAGGGAIGATVAGVGAGAGATGAGVSAIATAAGAALGLGQEIYPLNLKRRRKHKLDHAS